MKLLTIALAMVSIALSVVTWSDEVETQDISSENWDVSEPPLPSREIPIEVTEGTWMSLDVSPDGKSIAFDLLGDIYLIPIAGGEATNISSGLPWEIQPRFSPDGSRIAYISDRAGGDNIWVMDADGGESRPVTSETFRLLNNPTWSADGRYIAARKHFTTSRSLGTGEIWLYHVLGGSGLALVERSSETFQKELGEPVFSPQGDAIYFTKNVTSGNQFIYAQDSNTDLFNILRYDMSTGETSTAVEGAGGAVRPAPSPDGRSLAFVRRERTKSMLYLKDLTSGEEKRIYADLDQDMQETWGVSGMYPNMDWTPDSESIVFWAGGKIKRIDVNSGVTKDIPFNVTDTRTVIDPPRPNVAVAPERFATRMPRFAAFSPKGDKAVFETMGKLWIKSGENAEPKRLTKDRSDRRELFPTWSRDGKTIAFVSWSDDALGAIHTVSASGGSERKLTKEPGHYRLPRFSPDGKQIVFEKGQGGKLTDSRWSEAPGIYVISSRGGKSSKVTDTGNWPHFGPANNRVYLTRKGEAVELVSVDLDGYNERVHATSELVREYQIAPDGRHLAFNENYDVFVMPLLPGPQVLSAGKDAGGMPLVEVSGHGSAYMHWGNNGGSIHWSLGPVVFSSSIDNLRPVPETWSAQQDSENASNEEVIGYQPPNAGWNLSMEFDADVPQGVTAFTHANVITMNDADEVHKDVTLIVENNRIQGMGADVVIPNGANVIDMTGKWITPGFIDAHAHGPQGEGDIIPQQNWSLIAHLALGVTTIHDPSSRASHIFSAAEYQRSGELLGPRIYSTGEIVYGAKRPGTYASIESYEDAKDHVFRLAKQGAHSIKNYNQPRRDQRQKVVAAAIEAGVAVVAEGGAHYHMDMAMVADGNTSIEHNIPQAMIYEDVLSMYSQTEVAYTPTLVVTYGGLAGDPYWRQATDVWLHPILSKHVPPHVLQPATVRRTTAPDSDFADQVSAKTAHLLKERGVLVSIGAHGQQQGLAAHWEIWSFVRGGFSPMEALRAATIVPAQHLGFADDIGSIESGKLADLVVMNANPLEDINNTDEIDQVMLNGRLYDADTMNEVRADAAKKRSYYWE